MVIQTEGLTKIFRDFWHRPRVKAVDDLTLSVRQGEVYGLLGPNGSGKSTTVKMVLGLLFSTRGHISVFGRPPTDVGTKRRIGFLPEETHLYHYLNASETLDFYGRLFSLPAAERRHRVESLLRMTGLSAARNRLLGEYSKGMARRIGLAQALINDPELVILDEPTAGLDPIGTREVKDLILHLKGQGKTIVLCSHLLSDVEDVCDRIAILYGGRKQAEGMTRDLLRHERFTQITAAMDGKTVAEVLSLIQKREGAKAEVSVAPVTERLERFFLRVVEEARSARQDTSGVGATDRTLDFLTARRVEAPTVLERLVQPHAEPVSETVSPASPPRRANAPAPVDAKVLDAFTQPKGHPPAEEYSATSAAPSPSPKEKTGEKPDRSVLDRLTEASHEEPRA
ncbi:MAG: ATP-binding cassette domain-containing protein [Planctomycetota bacterium]